MVFSLGELLVEIFRKGDVPFNEPGEFLGPYPSGAPAIFIHALACLGEATGYFATIGKDDFGKCLEEKLIKSGIRTDWLVHLDDWTTGVAFTHFRSDGSREFIYHSGNAAVGQLGPEMLDREALSNCKWLHLCGNVLGISEKTRAASYEAARIVKKAGGRISFDPNIRFELMRREDVWPLCQPIVEVAEIVLPSGAEAEHLSGVSGDNEACRAILKLGPKIVALKLGEKGSKVFTTRDEFEVPSFQVTEVDPTGAGDCFDAGFVYGLLRDWKLYECARFANAVGALTVTKQGAMEAEISLSEVEQLMNGGVAG
ncbi:MAG: sugar kinase [Armatimonadota bacterium]